MRQEIEHLRVARLFEVGVPLTGDEVFAIGSIAGTLRARFQYYAPSKCVVEGSSSAGWFWGRLRRGSPRPPPSGIGV